MPFRDPIVAGNTLVREAIQSQNFVAGVSGWRIASDGSAEFSDVLTRGEFRTGDTGQRVVISDVGAGGLIRLFSGDPDEIQAAFLLCFTNVVTGNNPWFQVASATIGAGGRADLILKPGTGALDSARALFATNGPVRGVVELDTDMALLAPTMRAVAFVDNAVRDTTLATYSVCGTATATVTVPPSGVVRVDFGGGLYNGIAANQCELTFRIRNTNAGGAIVFDGAIGGPYSLYKAGDITTYGMVSGARLIPALTPGMVIYTELVSRSSTAGNLARVQVPWVMVTPQP